MNFCSDWFLHLYSPVTSKRQRRCIKDESNPDSLRSCLCFQVFRLSFASDFILLLVRFHQAEIIFMKHFIQGCDNETGIGVEPSTLRSWLSQKRRSEPLGDVADWNANLRMLGIIKAPCPDLATQTRSWHGLHPYLFHSSFFNRDLLKFFPFLFQFTFLHNGWRMALEVNRKVRWSIFTFFLSVLFILKLVN